MDLVKEEASDGLGPCVERERGGSWNAGSVGLVQLAAHAAATSSNRPRPPPPHVRAPIVSCSLSGLVHWSAPPCLIRRPAPHCTPRSPSPTTTKRVGRPPPSLISCLTSRVGASRQNRQEASSLFLLFYVLVSTLFLEKAMHSGRNLKTEIAEDKRM